MFNEFIQIFWVSLIFDYSSSRTNNIGIKSWLLTGSRVANFALVYGGCHRQNRLPDR